MTETTLLLPTPARADLRVDAYLGNIAALSGLDLTVNKGDLFGFIGSNGAGKTTTLRILATFLAPSAGRAQVLGHDVVKDADAVRHVIGYMPDFFGVYKDMEVTEYLDFFGACYKIPTAQREKTVNDVLELVGLSEKKGSLIGALSRGMQQRLGLARVLIHDPQLPVVGRAGQRIGPEGAHRDDGRAPGTPAPGQDHHHLLSHPERTPDPLQPGRHYRKGQAHLQRAGPGCPRPDGPGTGRLGAGARATRPRPSSCSRTRPEIAEVDTEDGEIKVTLSSLDTDRSIVADVLVRGGAKLIGLREDEIGLEEVFMRVTRGETQ